MTELKKTVYMSNDGRVFNTREECLEYELNGCGELSRIKSRIVVRIEELRRYIQFAKSKCNNFMCLGYALRMKREAKAAYTSALRKKKIKLEDAKELKRVLSTYISAVESYNEAVATFNSKKKTLREYVEIDRIAANCNSLKEYDEKVGIVNSWATRRHIVSLLSGNS